MFYLITIIIYYCQVKFGLSNYVPYVLKNNNYYWFSKNSYIILHENYNHKFWPYKNYIIKEYLTIHSEIFLL